MNMTKLAVACVLLGGVAAPAYAQTAVTAFTGGSISNPSGIEQPWTVGYSFTANQNLSVTALGFYDLDGNGLAVDHQVGIWDNAGNLLGSATVVAGTSATLNNGYRYVTTSALSLLSGQSYTIGANSPINGDSYYFAPITVTTDPAITFGSGLRSDSNTGFVRPTLAPNSGRFGPNFQFVTANSAVPEPAVWAMLMLGFGGIGCAMRRRSTVSARIRFV